VFRCGEGGFVVRCWMRLRRGLCGGWIVVEAGRREVEGRGIMLRLVRRVRVGWRLLESGLARKISLFMMIELIVIA
jgi:hypothetical protein